MIRVAFILPHLRPGGAERCVVNWIGALDRARFRPYLFLKQVEGAFLDLLPADVIPIALGGVRAARLPAAIGKALAEHEIDLAYSATNAMNLALLAARTPARRIVSEHTPLRAYLAEAKLTLLRRLAMQRLYPRADAIAVPTDRIGAELSEALGLRLPTVTLPNPVTHSLGAAPRPGTDGVLRIVSAGRLVQAKGFDTLIDAAAIVAAQGVAFRLDLLGDGPLDADLRARIDTRGLADRVTLHGNGDLTAALAEADLFVLASRREGFGNVVIEAMAAGVPVLATRGGGPETIIADGTNGWLAPPDDPARLADVIAALARDPRRRRVIDAARTTAAGFSVAASTNALSALIERLAAARSMAA